MATTAELLMQIKVDSSGLRKNVKTIEKQLNQAFGPELVALSGKLTGRLGSLASSIASVGAASVMMAADTQANRAAFTQLLGDSNKASIFLHDLANFAAETTFDMPGLVDAAKSLLAFQFEAQDVIPILGAVGDAVAVMGGGEEAVNGIIKALGQIQAEGTLSASAVNQLASNNIDAWKYVAQELGVSVPAAMKLTEQGAISSATAINAVVKGMQSEFSGGMAAIAQEIPALLEAVKKNVLQVGTEIGEVLIRSLGLKSALEEVVKDLSEFANKVRDSGIKAALLDMVPPELLAGIFVIATALTAVAIPAIISFAGAVALAVYSAAPLLLVCTAIGVAAYEIWKNWEPITELFNTIMAHISNNMEIWLAKIELMFYSTLQSILMMIESLNDLVGGGLQQVISSYLDKVSGKLKEVKDIIEEAGKIGDANDEKMKNAIGKVSLGLEKQPITGSLRDIKEVGAETTKVFTGLSHAVGAVGDNSAATANAATMAWESLKTKAEQVHKSIVQEWMQTTQTQLTQLDYWKAEQLRALNETAAANKDYQEDVKKLDEIYSTKRLKIALDEEKEKARIKDSSAKIMRDIHERQAILKLPTITNAEGGTETSRVALAKYNIENDFNKQIEDIGNRYKDWITKYNEGTVDQQERFREAWRASGIVFEKTSEGMLDFSKQINKEEVLATQEKNAKLKALNESYAKWKEGLDSAYNAGNITEYKNLLTNQRAAMESNLAANQSIMDTYHAAMLAKNASTAQLIANLYNQGLSGLTTVFSDIFAGIKSSEDAFRSFGQTMVKVITDYYAAKLAGMIMTKIIGDKGAGGQLASDTAAGAATAAAWLPAAIFRSLATAGGNAAPAIAGMAAATAAGMAMSSIAAFATGGHVRGPGTSKSDSILARLSDNEYVVQSDAVRAVGTDYLDMINQGIIPAFATDGFVTGPSLESLGIARYKTAAPYHERNNTNASSTTKNTRPTSSKQPIIIQALDGKSVERWLENTGGRKIEKYFTKRAREFAPVGV